MLGEHTVFYAIGIALCIAAQSAIILLLLAQRRNMIKRKHVEDVLRFQKALLESQSEAAPDGILVVSPEGRILSYNQRFVSMWQLPADVVEARADKNVLQLVAERVATPDDFLARVHHLYAHPDEQGRDEILLKNDCVFERYSTPIASRDGAIHGRIWFFRDITDRKHRETELQEWTRRYDLIVAASGQVAYDYDAPTGAIIWGHTIEQVLGYPLTEISQGFRQWVDLLHPDDRERTLKTLDAAEADCAFWDAEYRMRHKDGQYVWIRDRGFFLPDAAGKAVRQLGMLENITTLKQAEETLRDSEERLRSFVEQTSESVMMTDEEGRILEWNPANERISGLSRAEVLGQYCWDVAIRMMPAERRTPENRTQIERTIREILRTGQPLFTGMAEYEYERVDGERRIAQQVMFPIKTARGYCFGSLSHDVTERKRAEEELRRYREQLEELVEARTAELQREIAAHERTERALRENEANITALIENTDSIIWSIDREYRLIVGNTVFHETRRLAEGSEYVKGERVITEVAPKAFRDVWYGYYDRALAGERFTCEERRQFPHAGEWWEFRLSPIQSGGGETLGATVLGRDITANKRAEADLRAAKEAAETAQRASESANQAKSIFLSNMSHELRTPLNAILGFAQILARDATLSPEHRELLETINRSGEHLLKLINNVLNLSRIEAGRISVNRQAFDFWRMLANIGEMIRVRADEKGLQFSIDRAPDVPRYIITDEGKLRQVLINLLGNAVKFTEHGEVKLKIEDRHDASSQSSISQSVPGQTSILQFSIHDTGPGIPPEELPTIFEAFRQTSLVKSHEGAGLGLGISRRFVRLLGGDIQVHSTVGQGSRFTFTIQVEPAEHGSVAALFPARVVRGLAPHHSPIKILVVDDHVESRQFLTLLLSTVGFTVNAVTNGREALTQAQTWLPDLILMDMRMPVMDGYEATQEIRSLEAENSPSRIPIVALTASAFEEEQSRILAAGCDTVLRKPISTDELFETLQTYLNVEYLYANDEFLPEKSIPAGNGAALTPDALVTLPIELVEGLKQAAITSDQELMAQVVAAIHVQDAELANSILHLVHNFKYQTIWNMIQQMPPAGGTTHDNQ